MFTTVGILSPFRTRPTIFCEIVEEECLGVPKEQLLLTSSLFSIHAPPILSYMLISTTKPINGTKIEGPAVFATSVVVCFFLTPTNEDLYHFQVLKQNTLLYMSSRLR